MNRERYSSTLRKHFTISYQEFRYSVRLLINKPIQTLITALVIAIALVLPSLLYLINNNLSKVSSGIKLQNSINLYLVTGTSQQRISNLQARLNDDVNIERIHYVSPEQGLVHFKQWSGLNSVLDLLDDNPLPPLIEVTPLVSLTGVDLQQLYTTLKKEPIVKHVQFDLQWVQRLTAISALINRVVFILTVLLSIGVLLIIGNTIRLAIERRRDEIIVSKLIGATDAFVRRPFLFSGWWYGFFGGSLAVIIVLSCITWLGEAVEQIGQLYGASSVGLSGFSLSENLSLVISASLLGWLGAWVAAGQHLKHCEPQ